MNWPIEQKSIYDIFLDPKNIRIPFTAETQKALIQDLFSNENAFELVKSISAFGLFPDEFPIVTFEGGKLLVIEGNRRLAALKALAEPDIVPSFKTKLEHHKKGVTESLRCVVAPSREVAMKLIANKHTINLRKAWKPLRQAYFYQSQLDNGRTISELLHEYPDHEIVKFIRMLEMHKLAKSIVFEDDQVKADVHNERTFPITNLERMYTDPNVRNFLGFDFDESGKIDGKIEISEFNRGYSKIVEDVATGKIDSRKYNTDAQREEYLASLPSHNRPNKSKTGKFTTAGVKPTTAPKRARTPVDTSSKVPKGLFHSTKVPFRVNSTSLRLLYNELRDLPVKTFPNASHDLLRSFLECALVFYLKEKKHYDKLLKSDRHNPKLSELLTYVVSNDAGLIADPNLLQVVSQIKSDYSESYSLERLNMINHNENWVSSEKDVRSAWAKLEVLIKELLNP